MGGQTEPPGGLSRPSRPLRAAGRCWVRGRGAARRWVPRSGPQLHRGRSRAPGPPGALSARPPEPRTAASCHDPAAPLPEKKPVLVIKPGSYFLTTPTPLESRQGPLGVAEASFLWPPGLGAVLRPSPGWRGLQAGASAEGGERASPGSVNRATREARPILVHRVSVLQMRSVDWARI